MEKKIDELKSTGLKVTVPRLKVLEIFQNAAERHLSAEDVYKALLADDSDIGLATVYRVLAQFEQAGLLSRSYFEPSKAVYELSDEDHHDHLICLDCGRVEEFFDAKIEERKTAIARGRGFKLEDHVLSLYGRCIKDPCPHDPKNTPDEKQD